MYATFTNRLCNHTEVPVTWRFGTNTCTVTPLMRTVGDGCRIVSIYIHFGLLMPQETRQGSDVLIEKRTKLNMTRVETTAKYYKNTKWISYKTRQLVPTPFFKTQFLCLPTNLTLGLPLGFPPGDLLFQNYHAKHFKRTRRQAKTFRFTETQVGNIPKSLSADWNDHKRWDYFSALPPPKSHGY